MCTVSFVPAGNQKFFLTSNRDETLSRGLASEPQLFEYEGVKIICPRDPLANGSWIAAAENHRLTCLLNGAFEKHKRNLPYRKSRGMVVLDSLLFDSAPSFVSAYDFSNIEPFTMIMVSNEKKRVLHELRWDGTGKFFKAMDENAWHLWSSVTLYNQDLIAEKEQVFRKELLAMPQISSEQLSAIHQKYFLYEDWVKPPAKVPEVATLSVTSVAGEPQHMLMHYHDLVRKDVPVVTLAI